MRYFVPFIVLFLMIGCTSESSENLKTGELVGLIESKSFIGDLTEEEYDPTWLDVSNRKEMLSDWFDKIKEGEFEVFAYLIDTMIPLTEEELAFAFHSVDTEFVALSAYETDTIPYENHLDLDGIVSLKFKEELYYDDSRGVFDKKVKYVCPMEKVFNHDGTTRGYKGLFWVKVD